MKALPSAGAMITRLRRTRKVFCPHCQGSRRLNADWL